MKLFSIALFFPLLVAAASVDAKKRPFAVFPKNKKSALVSGPTSVTTATTAALSLRGGGGDLSPTTVAKWFYRLGLAQGIVHSSAPKKSLESYGVKPVTALTEWLCDYTGQALISLFIFSHCLLDRGLSVNKAAAYSQIVWILANIRTILSDIPETVGVNKEGLYGFQVLHVAMCWAVFSGHDMADNLVKFECLLNLSMGLLFVVTPKQSAKLWGYQGDIGDADVSQFKNVGVCLLSTMVWMFLMLFQDKSALEGAGYAVLPLLAFVVDVLFISKDCDKMDVPKLPIYAWFAVHAAAAYFILK